MHNKVRLFRHAARVIQKWVGMDNTIFICFRKADERLARGRLYQHLVEQFGERHVFKSGAAIPPGSQYAPILLQQAAESEVMLVLIGPKWLDAQTDAGQRLLDRPDDWVRTEIATSLKSGNTVIPVLIGASTLLPNPADLPADIARLGELQFRRISDSSLEADLDQLSETLTKMIPGLKESTPMVDKPEQVRTGNLSIGGNAKGPVVQGSNSGKVAGRDIKSKSSVKKNNPLIALGAIAAIVIVVLLLTKVVVPALHNLSADAGLTADSTCLQFLNTDEQTEAQALVDISTSMGYSGWGSPLALPEIRYECSGTPSMTLSAIIRRDGNEFG